MYGRGVLRLVTGRLELKPLTARAAAALIDWALSQPEVRVLVAGCRPDNVPSIRTLERAGFHRSGEADGEIRWRYGNYSGEV